MTDQPGAAPSGKANSGGARAWALLPLALFVALGGLFVWGMLGQRVDRHASPLVGTQAPPAVLPTLDGGQFDLAALRGQTIVLNVFASWCGPCRIEHPQLIQMARDTRFVLVGLAYRDDPADTSAYLEELGDPYKAVAIDRQGAVGVSFGLTGVPETYIIAPNGVVIKKVTGEITPRLAAEIAREAAAATAGRG